MANTTHSSFSGPFLDSVTVSRSEITAHLKDGRVVSVPIDWSWRLANASPTERSLVEVSPSGTGAHWPMIDEDLSVNLFFREEPVRRPSEEAQCELLESARMFWRESLGTRSLVPTVTTERLVAAKPLLNVSAIARQAGINPRTLATKMDRGTALTGDEADAVRTVLTSLVDSIRS